MITESIEELEEQVREVLSLVFKEVPHDLAHLYNQFLEGYYDDMPMSFFSAMGIYGAARKKRKELDEFRVSLASNEVHKGRRKSSWRLPKASARVSLSNDEVCNGADPMPRSLMLTFI